MKKDGWPDFPYNHWTTIKKWNMSSLRLVASHLEGKTHSLRQRASVGYPGGGSDRENQIVQHIADLEQQMFELEDTVQALLQIIDDNRPSQRVRKFFHWISQGVSRCKERLQRSTVYWILGLLGVLASLYAAAKFLFHYFGK